MKINIFIVYLFLAVFFSELMGIEIWPKPPLTISTSNVNADSPQIAVDPIGNQVAIWIEDDFIVSKTCDFGMSWGPIDYLSAKGSTSPQVVIDSNSKATTAWVNEGIIFSSEKNWGGTWSSPERLTEGGASEYKIAIDQLGNIVIAWIESGALLVKTKAVDSEWSPIASIVSPSGARNLDIAIGADLVVVVWEGRDQAIYSSNGLFEKKWSDPLKISDENILTCNPAVAVNVSSEAFLAWFRFDQNGENFSNGNVQAAIYSDGLWTLPQDISNPNSSIIVDPQRLQLAVKSYSSDLAIVAWTSSYDGSYYNVEWTIFNGRDWEIPYLLLSNPLPTQFALGVDSQNYAYLVSNYLDPDDGILKLYGGLFNLKINREIADLPIYPWIFSSKGNSCSNNISTSVISEQSPVISSPVSMVWKNYDGNFIVIEQLQVMIPILDPPTDLKVETIPQDYGVFFQYNNKLTWSPSSSDLVTAYAIFRNGIYLGKVPNTTLFYIDLNRDNMSNTYTIFGFCEYGFTSVGAEIHFP